MKVTVNQKLGKKIRKRRMELGLSQEELAELADLHRTYIGQVERAEKNVSILTLDKIAKALKFSLSEIVDFEDID